MYQENRTDMPDLNIHQTFELAEVIHVGSSLAFPHTKTSIFTLTAVSLMGPYFLCKTLKGKIYANVTLFSFVYVVICASAASINCIY